MKNELMELSQDKGFLSRDEYVNVTLDYYYLWMCELQQWLREKHNCIVECNFVKQEGINLLKYESTIDYYGINWEIEQTENYDFVSSLYETYEEALEESLKQALQLIK